MRIMPQPMLTPRRSTKSMMAQVYRSSSRGRREHYQFELIGNAPSLFNHDIHASKARWIRCHPTVHQLGLGYTPVLAKRDDIYSCFQVPSWRSRQAVRNQETRISCMILNFEYSLQKCCIGYFFDGLSQSPVQNEWWAM